MLRNLSFLVAFLLTGSAWAASDSVIASAHGGRWACKCLHKSCGQSSAGKVTQIAIEPANDSLTIDYGDEVHSGRPAKIAYKGGGLNYVLASGGRVWFTKKDEFGFGLGKLWTCEKQ